MTKWNNGKYILLKGFAKKFCDINNFSNLVENSVCVNHIHNDGGRLSSLMIGTQNPIYNFLIESKQIIESAVEKKFKLENLDMKFSGNLMNFRDGIDMHNDWFDLNKTHHPDAVVARGVLSLNPTYIFGTNAYLSSNPETFVGEFGGYPGDLFIFKCSPDSWHSVGFKKERHPPRYSMNITFRVKK